MKKEGINYLLLNSTFFIFIIYILSKLDILESIKSTVVLIFLSLILSYIIYPIYKKVSNILSNTLSIIIIYSLLLLFIFILSNILKFEDIINNKYNLNLDLNKYLEIILNYSIKNSILIIKNIFNYLTKILFIIILSICILMNVNYIKIAINKLNNKKLLYNINNRLRDYLSSSFKIIIIQFIEYTLLFLIIGHPNYLLLGLLNSINTFIPFIGSSLTNIIAITTASVISKKLLIFTSVISIIMPQIDCYLITPKIYKGKNKISETLYITTMIILGTIFNFYGVIFSLPILIITIEILKYKNIVKDI